MNILNVGLGDESETVGTAKCPHCNVVSAFDIFPTRMQISPYLRRNPLTSKHGGSLEAIEARSRAEAARASLSGIDKSVSFLENQVFPKHVGVSLTSDNSEYIEMRVLSCHSCRNNVVIHDYFSDEILEKSVVVIPTASGRMLDDSVPEGIRSLFKEASDSLYGGCYRAAAGLFRATMEELAIDFGTTAQGFAGKITQLKLILDEDQIDILNDSKLVGDNSMHRGVIFSKEELLDLEWLIEDLTIQLYVNPDRRQKLRESRKAKDQPYN